MMVMARVLLPLAQIRPSGARSITPMLLWLGAIMLIVVVTGVAVLIYRRRVLSKEAAGEAQARLMDEMRAMRDRGEISIEEYERMKSRLVARVAGRPVSDRHPTPAPAHAQTLPDRGDVRQSRPGFDLTGAPLPRPKDEESPPQ